MIDIPKRDFHLIAGRWEPADLFADQPGDQTEEHYLESLGWREFLSLGDSRSYLQIKSWQRIPEDGPSEYLVEVGDPLGAGPYLKVASFPELMDVFARWGPAVAAATVAGLAAELTEVALVDGGLVETIAARAVEGVEVTRRQLVDERTARRERARQLRAARDAAPAPASPQEPR